MLSGPRQEQLHDHILTGHRPSGIRNGDDNGVEKSGEMRGGASKLKILYGAEPPLTETLPKRQELNRTWIKRARRRALAFVTCIFILWQYNNSPSLGIRFRHCQDVLHSKSQKPLTILPGLPDFVPGPNVSLIPFTFKPLPLGSIRPLGWIRDQMELMSKGLAGHQYEFYHVVKDSPWLGGHFEYSVLNEGFPYWFNGLVPLAYGLNDSRLIHQVNDASDQVLKRQHSDGWMGPESVGGRDLWARFPLFLGLSQLVEADPSRADKIIPAMYSFIYLMRLMLIENVGFDQIWGRVRYQDMLISLQWLYENHPEGNEHTLLETMYLLLSRGLHWSDWWSNGTFIFADLDSVQPPITDQSPEFPFVHGVNAAQGLKAGAAIYRFTANESLLGNNRIGVNWTFTYHGDPAGSIIGDEREAGTNANRGSELCSAVETMYSMSYLYQTLGDNYFADRCELAAFNALPVSITGNHWAHQYLTLASGPIADALESPTPFWNVGSHGIVYGLEPNYPCCTVNMPQGLPKYLSAAFVRVGNNGIAHGLLGPAQVSTNTPSDTFVTVATDTIYPFSPILNYNISASAPFTFYVRVPSWYVPTNSSVSLNDNGAEYPLAPDHHTGLTPLSIPAGNSTVKIYFGAQIRVVPRANSTVAIYYGSLLYALDVGQTTTVLGPTLYNTSFTGGDGPYNTNSPILPTEVHNYAFTNTTPWDIAIDTSTLIFHTTSNVTSEKTLANPIFEYKAPPTYITGKGCQISWRLYKGLPEPLPALPHRASHRTCTGNITDIVLRPYGSLKIHMAELPTVDLSRNVSEIAAMK